METGLTADDVLLLSEWAASADRSTSGSTSDGVATESSDTPLTRDGDTSTAVTDDLQLFFGVIDDDDRELAATDAPRRTRKKRRATYLRTKVSLSAAFVAVRTSTGS